MIRAPSLALRLAALPLAAAIALSQGGRATGWVPCPVHDHSTPASSGTHRSHTPPSDNGQSESAPCSCTGACSVAPLALPAAVETRAPTALTVTPRLGLPALLVLHQGPRPHVLPFATAPPSSPDLSDARA